jgi:hypothetical protein
VFNGGSYFLQSGLKNPGGFSLGLSGINTLGVSGGYFNAFQSGGSGTFSASPVPEAGSGVLLSLGCVCLLGLMLRKPFRKAD